MTGKKRTKYEDGVVRRRKRTFLLSAGLLVLFVGLCYLFVWERVYTLRLAAENAQTRQRVHDLKDRLQSLEFDINQLASFKRIEDIARRDLALLPPQELLLASFTTTKPNVTPANAESVTTPVAAKTPVLAKATPTAKKSATVKAKSASPHKKSAKTQQLDSKRKDDKQQLAAKPTAKSIAPAARKKAIK